MIKSELANKMTDHLPALSEPLLKQSVNIITKTIAEALSQWQRIEIRGFGCLTTRKQAPRLARNPKTGKTFITDGGCKVHFKSSLLLRKRLNEA